MSPAPTVSVACLCLLAAALPSATGHSYMSVPKARNFVKHEGGEEQCPHCLQAGGPGTVKERLPSGLSLSQAWPLQARPASHGVCGDPVQGKQYTDFKDEPYLVPSAVQATYASGSVVEFEITVSTHHAGHYEYRICDRSVDSGNFNSAKDVDDCFSSYVLERAEPDASCAVNDQNADCQPIDPKHPGRWYLPPLDYGMTHKMRYKIPAGLSCEHCTLQWYWSTGNTCLYDEDYLSYFRGLKSKGWDTEKWSQNAAADWATKENIVCGYKGWAEEFWNCADIAVTGSGNGGGGSSGGNGGSSGDGGASTTASPGGGGGGSGSEPSPSPPPVDGGDSATTAAPCAGSTDSPRRLLTIRVNEPCADLVSGASWPAGVHACMLALVAVLTVVANDFLP